MYASINTIGDPAYTERGFVFGTTSALDVTRDTKVVVQGSGIGEYATDVSGLSRNTTYYLKGYMTSPSGTVYSGFNTFNISEITMPEVSIQGMNQGAKIIVKIVASNAGNPKYHTWGICYSTIPNPTREDNLIKAETALSGKTGTLASALSISNSIEVGKSYYVRAYLVSNAGIVYSNEYQSGTIVPYVPVNNLGFQVEDLGLLPYSEASNVCSASRIGGYSDWRLPTIAELAIMESNKENIGNFNSGYSSEIAGYTIDSSRSMMWWSNTAGKSSQYKKVMQITISGSSYTGRTYDGNISASFKVRCVRTLPSVPQVSAHAAQFFQK